MMNRILPLIIALTFVSVDLTAAEDATQPANVVFILADDLGWADTTLYGHTKFYRTPNIERLANRGMTFTRAYAASPLCSPTRSSILSGLSPARTGITTPNCHLPQVVLQATSGKPGPAANKSTICEPVTRFNTTYQTLSKSLQSAGYTTGHFGKWHLGHEPYSPLQHGFAVDLPHWPGPGPAGRYVAPWKFPDFDPDTPDEHIEDRMAREATAFLKANQDRPFFLNYWMFSVHAPFDAKPPLIEKYQTLANPAEAQRCPTYAAMIESMDDAVGTLMDTLDRLKLTDNTIIVFTSDNGGNMYSDVQGEVPTSNSPLRGGKATMYEGGVRVPCVVCWPGHIAGGQRCDDVIQSSDFYPTLLEMLKIPAANQQIFDGISIVPALQGERLTREAIFTYFPHQTRVPDWLPPSVSVHSGDWKLIRLFHGGDAGQHRWKLYNLADDLGEQHDLSGQRPDVVRNLDQLIEQFLADTHAVVPVPNPAFDPAQWNLADEGQSQRENTKTQTPKPAAADPLQGWKARGCDAVVRDGVLIATGNGKTPFLGVSAGRHSGPAAVTMRIRSPAAGTGRVEWLPGGPGEPANPMHSVAYSVTAEDNWQEISVDLPAEGSLGVVRIYLPQSDRPFQFDRIEIQSSGKPQRWGF